MLSSETAGEALQPALRRRVLEKLGFDRPPAPDLRSLQALYRAWCLRVPFDNVRKMISLRTPGTPPLAGGGADEFFDNWLTGRTGGTCWPGSNALYELVRSLGFDAVRVGASMRDTGVITHGSVRVTIDGRHWLIDSSLLTMIPVPVGDTVFVSPDPLFAAEIEPDGGTHLLWVDVPPSGFLCCRLLEYGVSHDFYLERYEASRSRSPFNDMIYARRNRKAELLVVRGPTLFRKTRAGVDAHELSRDELISCLHKEIGIAPAVVDEWVRMGCLEASFLPYTGPPPSEPDPRVPPSQRRG